MDRTLCRLHALGIVDNYTFYRQQGDHLLSNISFNKHLKFPQVHVGAVNWLSIDGQAEQFMLSAGADSSIHMWDLNQTKNREIDVTLRQGIHQDSIQDIQEIGTIDRGKTKGHGFGVSVIQWWPFDNGMFISGSFDGSIKVWDTDSLSEAYNFSMDVRVYNLDICTVPGSAGLVATACDHPFVRLIDLRSTSSAHTLVGHSGKVICAKWSPTSEYILATGGSDGGLRVWDIRQSNACLYELDLNRTDLEFRPQGAGFTRSIESLHTKYQRPKAHRGAINSVMWSPKGDYLISSGNDDKIKVWSLYPTGGRCMAINFGPLVRNKYSQTLGPCMTPVCQSEQPVIMVPSDNGEILMLNASDGTLVKRLVRGRNIARSTCIVGQGARSFRYYSGSLDGTISVWEPELRSSVEAKGRNEQSSEESSPGEVFA